MIPEITNELPESVQPLRERYNDVDKCSARVHNLTPNFHYGTKRPKKHKLSEFLWAAAFEGQLISGSSVPLCTSYPCGEQFST